MSCSTSTTAKEYGFSVSKIMFEFTEVEKLEDNKHIQRVVEY